MPGEALAARFTKPHVCVCAHACTHTHTHTGPYKEPAPSWACTPRPNDVPHSQPRSNPTLTNSCFHTPRPLFSLRRTCEIFCPCVPPVVGPLLSTLPPIPGWQWGECSELPSFLRSLSVSAEAPAPSWMVLQGLHSPLCAPPLLLPLPLCPPSFPSPFPPLSSHMSPQNPLSPLSLCRQGN